MPQLQKGQTVTVKAHQRIATHWIGTTSSEEKYTVPEYTGTISDIYKDGGVVVYSAKYGYLEVNANQIK